MGNQRTTTLITVDQALNDGVHQTADVAQKLLFQVGDYQLNKSLFDE